MNHYARESEVGELIGMFTRDEGCNRNAVAEIVSILGGELYNMQRPVDARTKKGREVNAICSELRDIARRIDCLYGDR